MQPRRASRRIHCGDGNVKRQAHRTRRATRNNADPAAGDTKAVKSNSGKRKAVFGNVNCFYILSSDGGLVQALAEGVGELLQLERLGEKVDAFLQWNIFGDDVGTITTHVNHL